RIGSGQSQLLERGGDHVGSHGAFQDQEPVGDEVLVIGRRQHGGRGALGRGRGFALWDHVSSLSVLSRCAPSARTTASKRPIFSVSPRSTKRVARTISTRGRRVR